MRRVISIAILMLPVMAVADPLEIGAYLGQDSTNIYTRGPCPVLRAPAAPADGDHECTSNPTYGSHGGVLGGFVRYRIVPAVQLEAALTYAHKGYWNGLDIDLHYVEAPLVVKFDPLAEVSPARVFVLVGVAPAMLAGCHASGLLFNNDPPPHAEMTSQACSDLPPYLDVTPNRFDLGIVAGVGVAWQFWFGSVDVQARIVRGIVNTDRTDDVSKTINDASYVVAGFSKTL